MGALSLSRLQSHGMYVDVHEIYSFISRAREGKLGFFETRKLANSLENLKTADNANTPRIVKTLTWVMIWKRTAIFAPGQLSISICKELEISKKRFSLDLTDLYIHICDYATETVRSLRYTHECSGFDLTTRLGLGSNNETFLRVT